MCLCVFIIVCFLLSFLHRYTKKRKRGLVTHNTQFKNTHNWIGINEVNWTDYIRQLYQLCCDCDVFGADPLMALEVVGMALDRTHSEMTKADTFFVQNVLGDYRERLDLTTPLQSLWKD